MVTENQETEQASLPNLEAPPTDGVTDTGDALPPTDVQDIPATDPGVAPSAEAAPAPVDGVAPAPEPTPEPQAPSGPSPTELQQLQRQAAEYEQIRLKASLQQEGTKYQRQLEEQGYMPEQAQKASQQYMQSRQAQVNLMKKAEEYGQHLTGKTAAAEHFAQKYNLALADLPMLRQAETPEVMEELAKNVSKRRKDDTELAQLRQARVPPQQFDTSQGEPQVAANDSSWLDRYNGGDRSPSALAAAKKAAGFT